VRNASWNSGGNVSSPAAERSRRYEIPSPAQQRWPGLASPPPAGTRAAIARAIFGRAVSRLKLRATLPDGRVLGHGGARSPVMRIHNAKEFFARLGADGKVGFGESYMTGSWTADDLAGVLTVFAEQITTLVPPILQSLRRFYDQRRPTEEENTLAGAKTNIQRHYDLSNDLFALFLDESMTYSAAWYGPGETLEQAQVRKIDGILDMARVGPDTHLLEIGTGWGSLAIRAAVERGARVTSLTLSEEQKTLAEQRIAAAGVADRVQVVIHDYREAQGRYDAIASVEMIEAVGERYLPAYFRALDRLLKPGGWIGLQAITMPHHRMVASRNSYTWIHKYIFPGGLLPSFRLIEQQVRSHTALRVIERRDLSSDYAQTLQEWRTRFLAQTDKVLSLGFDQTFIKMWEFYLAYCEAGFRSRYLRDFQLGLRRDH
jgi:cyclopropane-fatty-acyl-phospholipid synthase